MMSLGPGLKQVSFTVRPDSFTAPTVLSPATPVFVDDGVRVTTVGRDGYFASLERDGNGPYTVTALVPDPDSPDGPTDAALRGAGTAYPADVIALYTAEVPDMFGREPACASRRGRPNIQFARRRTTSRSAWSRCSTPTPFTTTRTSATLTAARCRPPECFATSKRGYCHALRDHDGGHPPRPRYPRPGRRRGSCLGNAMTATPRDRVQSARHTPGSRSTSRATSWVAFDPTGGGIAG